MMTQPPFYYFGCHGKINPVVKKHIVWTHHLWAPGMIQENGVLPDLPFTWQTDSGHCWLLSCVTPQEGETAEVTLTQLNGWTAIAFWDRTGDPQPGSYSAFLAHALLSYKKMITLAARHFPEVYQRVLPLLKFPGEPPHE